MAATEEQDDTLVVEGFLPETRAAPVRVLVRARRPVRLQWAQGERTVVQADLGAGATALEPPPELLDASAPAALLRVLSRPGTPAGLLQQAVLSEHRLALPAPPPRATANQLALTSPLGADAERLDLRSDGARVLRWGDTLAVALPKGTSGLLASALRGRASDARRLLIWTPYKHGCAPGFCASALGLPGCARTGQLLADAAALFGGPVTLVLQGAPLHLELDLRDAAGREARLVCCCQGAARPTPLWRALLARALAAFGAGGAGPWTSVAFALPGDGAGVPVGVPLRARCACCSRRRVPP